MSILYEIPKPMHAFIHLDGAVKIYRRNQYAQRHATMMPNEFKVWKKIKVFRIDADVEGGQAISDNEWSRLLGLVFQENTLVAEYLNPNFVNEGYYRLFSESYHLIQPGILTRPA